MDDAALARLQAVLAQHQRAQGVNPRDHGVVAIADLRALLAAYDQDAPVLAAVEAWYLGNQNNDASARLDDAIGVWRAAREG